MDEPIAEMVNESNHTPLILMGIVSFGIGIGVGYFLGRRKPKEVHVIPAIEEEINYDQMKDLIREAQEESGIEDEIIIPGKTIIDPEAEKRNVKKAAEEFIAEHIPADVVIRDEDIRDEETFEPVAKSVFAGAKDKNDGWIYEEELKTRTEIRPYVIHEDEYFQNEKDYSQIVLTYYAGDDIMVDEADKPIYNHTDVVGELRFGHGSGDPNVFFVRNDKRHAEYEIMREGGLYSVEVLGHEIESNDRAKNVQHSKLDKFRPDD